MKTIIFAVLMLMLISAKEGYSQVPADLAVKAILGEAEDQGYRGMLAVACGIRNRGTLKGVYGVKAKRPNTPGMIEKRYWEMARKAWIESETNRIHPADHWENVKAFGMPKWAPGMQEVFKWKDHIFYTVKPSKPRKGIK